MHDDCGLPPHIFATAQPVLILGSDRKCNVARIRAAFRHKERVARAVGNCGKTRAVSGAGAAVDVLHRKCITRVMRTTRFFRAAVVPPAAAVDGVRMAETIVADSKGPGVSGLCVSFTSSRVGRANDCRNDALERGAVVKRLDFPHASGVAGGESRVTRLLFVVR